MDQNELSLEPQHLAVPSSASKTIFEPMVHSAPITHLSCINTNTVSKRTKMRFHVTHVTLEFHREHAKWFLSLWYVWRKPCTYLASRLALSPNGPKGSSTWALSPRSTVGCVQTISEPMVCSSQTDHLFCTNTNTVSKRTETSFRLSLVT
jgi:hypothetical protein